MSDMSETEIYVCDLPAAITDNAAGQLWFHAFTAICMGMVTAPTYTIVVNPDDGIDLEFHIPDLTETEASYIFQQLHELAQVVGGEAGMTYYADGLPEAFTADEINDDLEASSDSDSTEVPAWLQEQFNAAAARYPNILIHSPEDHNEG